MIDIEVSQCQACFFIRHSAMKPDIFYRRKDFQTALAIDCAMIILKNTGLPQAYSALLANGIPGKTVRRLLSMPNKCRRLNVSNIVPTEDKDCAD